MGKVFQDLNTVTYDSIRLPAFDVDDQANPASVVFLTRIVKSLCATRVRYGLGGSCGLFGSVRSYGGSLRGGPAILLYTGVKP